MVFKSQYSIKGKNWCIENLNMSDGQIRYFATKFNLKSNFKFNSESNYKRGSSFRGKKRPEHSEYLQNHHPLRELHHLSITKEKISISNKLAHKEGRLKADNFRGHKHSDFAKIKMSDASRKMWANPNHYLNSEEHKQSVSDRMSIVAQSRKSETMYSRTKMGWTNIGGRKFFFRSSWELTYARYLEFLKDKKQIKSWGYEVDVFWFKKILRGVRSYKPDFKIKFKDGKIEYHEVKGYMDAKSKTKIKRMAKYYPEVKLIVIDSYAFKAIKKWERLFD